MKLKGEIEKAGLKLSIQKAKIMASGPIASWQIDWETMETVTDFIFLGSKITAYGDCSHEIKKTLAPWKKSYGKPRQHIKKKRHYFADKGLYSDLSFASSHAWIWVLDHKEGWVPKNWCFWTVVLDKTLESPLDCKEIKPVHPKGNQSWIFIEGLMIKLKLQYFGHLMWKAESLEKTLMLGGIRGRKKRGRPRMRWLDGITDSMDAIWVNSGSWWWTGRPGVLWFMGSQRVGHDWATELNWGSSNPI